MKQGAASHFTGATIAARKGKRAGVGKSVETGQTQKSPSLWERPEGTNMGLVILGQEHRGYRTVPFSDDVELLTANRFVD